jgi:hypothetical protein
MTIKIDATNGFIELDEQASAPSTPASGKARLYVDSKGILRWLNDDGTTGTGTLRGTAFPGSPATNDTFFRTDLGLLCYYDGTRWLSVDTFSAGSAGALLSSSIANANLSVHRLRGDYAPYFTYLTAVTRSATTNNGSNYWTITLEGQATALGTATTIGSFNTSADTVNIYTSHDGFTVSTANPTNRAHLNVNLTIGAGAPGSFLLDFTAFYKLIIT